MFRVDQVEDIPIEGIVIPDGRREVNRDAVEQIAQSIKEIGLLTPVTVKPAPTSDDEDRLELVAGHHRIEAARLLGWHTIECIIRECDEIDARLWEIAENLHRSELTVLERSEQINEWRQLVKERCRTVRHLQPAAAGVRETAKELGVSKDMVSRSKAIAGLSDEAKAAAKEHGLENATTKLAGAAKQETPEAQVHYLKNAKPQSPADRPLNDFEAREKQVATLMSAWNRASPEARQEFMARIDTPVFDKSGSW